MTTINIEEAQSDLVRLVERALAGEPFLIARNGQPLVKVEALAASPAAPLGPRRRLGFLEGKFEVPDDIKAPWRDEIEDLFGLED